MKNEEFWSFIETQPAFVALRTRTSGLAEKYGVRSLERTALTNPHWQELADARMDCKNHPDYCLAALKFLAGTGRVPVIVVDNVDQHGTQLCSLVVTELLRIREAFQIKTITAMRTDTYDRVRKYGLNTINPDVKRLPHPDVKAYTRKKADRLRGMLTKRTPLSTGPGVRVSVESERLLEDTLSMLLSDRCLDFLAAAAQNDLRRWNRLAEICFQSGLLDEVHLKGSAFPAYPYDSAERDKIALAPATPIAQNKPVGQFWMALVSIITRNHKTCFPAHLLGEEDGDLVPNLYCNGADQHNTYFIRLQILSYLDRHPGVSALRLMGEYTALFTDSERNPAETSLRHALLRLINCRLIDSTGRYLVKEEDSLSDLMELQITQYGQLWLNKLSGYYEALVYMKDDVWFDGAVPEGVKSCIEQNDVASRTESIRLYLRYMHAEERALLRNFANIEKKRAYLTKFARERRKPMFSTWMLREMHDYATLRVKHRQESPRMRQELSKIQEELGAAEKAEEGYVNSVFPEGTADEYVR